VSIPIVLRSYHSQDLYGAIGVKAFLIISSPGFDRNDLSLAMGTSVDLLDEKAGYSKWILRRYQGELAIRRKLRAANLYSVDP